MARSPFLDTYSNTRSNIQVHIPFTDLPGIIQFARSPFLDTYSYTRPNIQHGLSILVTIFLRIIEISHKPPFLDTYSNTRSAI